jgi:AcrR family transcriptional regulator
MSRRGGTAPDRAQRGEATRSALVAAARELFVTKGYFATGTEEIVAKAKVGTRGALYHHFADKQALFRAVFEAVEEDLLARANPTDTARDTAPDAWDQIVAGLQAFLTAALEPEVQRIILVDGPAVLGWNDWRALEARYGITIIEGALQVAMDQGTIRTQPRRELAHLILAAVDEAALLIAHSDDPEAARRNASEALGQLLEGLRR